MFCYTSVKAVGMILRHSDFVGWYQAAGLTIELLIMDDDSGEGTVQTEKTVQQLQAEKFAVQLHVRRRGEGRYRQVVDTVSGYCSGTLQKWNRVALN